MLSRLLFFIARILQRRGMLLGQWFQNKGILLLSKVKINNDETPR
tara:strand:- start:128 stop:262 length:135 start_codon:yes stop_codon:yes gene_type:complete